MSQEQDEIQTEKHLKDGIIDFTAGCLGGITNVYVGQPLDTVKVKMQTFPSMYTNMVDCFVKTLRVDGVARGLYAGTVPALATNIVENSVLFLCYGFCQKIMQRLTEAETVEDLDIVSNATAGFLASFFSSVAITPTELIKCQLQAMHETSKQRGNGTEGGRLGPLGLTARIARTEGLAGLFRGLSPTLAREMPGYFFFFGGYEGSRELLCKPGQKKEDIGLSKTMVAGSVGGTVFWSIVYPIDVVKSRIQVANIKENMFIVVYDIFRKEGIGALYNGLSPTLLRTIPSTAVLFATYEYSKKWLHYVFSDF